MHYVRLLRAVSLSLERGREPTYIKSRGIRRRQSMLCYSILFHSKIFQRMLRMYVILRWVSLLTHCPCFQDIPTSQMIRRSSILTWYGRIFRERRGESLIDWLLLIVHVRRGIKAYICSMNTCICWRHWWRMKYEWIGWENRHQSNKHRSKIFIGLFAKKEKCSAPFPLTRFGVSFSPPTSIRITDFYKIERLFLRYLPSVCIVLEFQGMMMRQKV